MNKTKIEFTMEDLVLIQEMASHGLELFEQAYNAASAIGADLSDPEKDQMKALQYVADKTEAMIEERMPEFDAGLIASREPLLKEAAVVPLESILRPTRPGVTPPSFC